MSILIRFIAFIMILLAFIVAILFFVYVISVELYEIFEVDVLWKFKRKLEVWCYGEKRKTKAMGKLLTRRTRRSKGNRNIKISINRRLRQREFDKKAVSQQKKKAAKQN